MVDDDKVTNGLLLLLLIAVDDPGDPAIMSRQPRVVFNAHLSHTHTAQGDKDFH